MSPSCLWAPLNSTAPIDPEDPEMLEDLITTAVNEAGKKADEMVQKSMSQVTGGLGLPGGMF